MQIEDLWPGVPAPTPDEAPKLRAERLRVRAFLAEAVERGRFEPACDSWLSGFSPEMSRELGARGWIGMTWPRRYGGREASNVLRLAVIEELLAAGAPVAAHWFADRQVGPGLLRHGTNEQREQLLPPMSRGELYVAIGMSEPDTGSDLASVRTRATPAPGGWRINGTKVWTSHAHRSALMLALVRTSAPDPRSRHAGLSQLLVDLAAPGVTINPILLLDGGHHFNEVVLDDVFVPESMVVGKVGDGWAQVMAELSYERSGPERYLSTFALLREMATTLGRSSEVRGPLGRIYGRLWVLRQMSIGIARSIDAGTAPPVVTALVKEMGTRLENDIIDEARRWRTDSQPSVDAEEAYERMLAQAQLHAPGFTLRGGTNEILRGLVARALGMR